MRPIYLDHNATTRPADEVVQAVAEAMRSDWGNPSSVHRFGQQVRARVELARESVARLINAQPAEIVFTSSGTESCNLAIFGVVRRLAPAKERSDGGSPHPGPPPQSRGREQSHPTRDVIITTPVEHSAVREPIERLEREGFTVVRLPVSRQGMLQRGDLAGAMEAHAGRVALISILWANNETGVIQPLSDLLRVAKEVDSKAIFHTDAVQWVGKMPTDVRALPVDLLSFAGHKFHGPKGIGGLYVRKGVRLQSQIVGGPHERERRGGTEDVPGILGLGVAAELAIKTLGESNSPQRSQRAQRKAADETDQKHQSNPSASSAISEVNSLHPAAQETAARRDRLEQRLLKEIPGSVINGTTNPNQRMWNTTNIGFDRLEAEAILLGLSERGVFASAGAACSSGSLDPSPILLAMGIEDHIAHGSIRLSLAQETTDAEVESAAETVVQVVERLRRVLPVS